MEKSLKCLIYAVKNNKAVEIITANGKIMKVYINSVDENGLKYRFINGNKISRINFENIVNVNLLKSEDRKNFTYECLSEKYKVSNMKELIENFKNYYLEMIEILLKETSDPKGIFNLNNKKRIYPTFFEKLLNDEDNLLFYYFSKNFPTSEKERYANEILLIEQANMSQKNALDNALNERVSIIEGPPGTGKTTTILNILSNLVYQNKKVLVVSKNNSAIENVVEELEKMNIPRCYLRMRKF